MSHSVLVFARIAHILTRFMEAEGVACAPLQYKLNAATRAERIPIEQWWELLEQLAETSGDPLVGLRVGRHARLQDAGVLGYLAASCATLGEALQRMQHYQALLQNLSCVGLRADGPHLHLGWAGDKGPSTDASNDVLVSGMLTVLDTLVSPHRVRPVQIEFPRPATANRTIHERALGCRVHFGGDTLAITIRLADLGLPINSQDAHLRQLLDQQAAAMLESLAHPDAFLIEFQRAMMRGLEEGALSMQWLSRQQQTPVRSLYRALRQRDRTYKGMLDELRQQLAKQYLADPALSLSEIALMLGYSEQSAFSRAFRGWYGETPLRYRKKPTGGKC